MPSVSCQEEAAIWKRKCESLQNDLIYWKRKHDEVEQEYEEFQQNSQMLERELETSLEQADKANREFRIKNNKLQLENDTLRDKYEQEHQELVAQLNELQDESVSYRNREENYIKYIRELEQKNDDLERSQRATYVSLVELESKLNSAIERNVLLESELDEKENLKAMVQRLKDETRDLKQEIQVKEKELRPDNDKATSVVSSTRRCNSFRLATSQNGSVMSDAGKRCSVSNTDSTRSSSHTHVKSLSGNNNSVLATPTRVSAMNIVGDLLRKVGALETKLANSRMTSNERPRESFRSRTRLNRGISSPTIHNLVRS